MKGGLCPGSRNLSVGRHGSRGVVALWHDKSGSVRVSYSSHSSCWFGAISLLMAKNID